MIGLGLAALLTVTTPTGPLLPGSTGLASMAIAPAPTSRGTGPLTAEEQRRRDEAVEALQGAEARATEQPETAEPVLRDALQGFAEVAPLVAEDAKAQSARTYAMLALARTLLVLDQRLAATTAMDAALRVAREQDLPTDQFGPSLGELHAERAAALAERSPASLEVRCRAGCRVLVDERPFEGGSLPAGEHRVWVESQTVGLPVLRRTIEPAPGETIALTYDVAPPPPKPEPTPEVAAAPPPRRLLPRWASVLGLVTGTVAAGAGGALVAVDHRCPDLSDPRLNDCPRILNTDAGGFTLVGLGGALALTSAVILTVDEVRRRRRRRAR